MKKKVVQPFLIILLFVISLLSVACLNTYLNERVTLNLPTEQTEIMGEQEYELPDVALIKKIIRLAHAAFIPVLE